jgi:hypothetical protein
LPVNVEKDGLVMEECVPMILKLPALSPNALTMQRLLKSMAKSNAFVKTGTQAMAKLVKMITNVFCKHTHVH